MSNTENTARRDQVVEQLPARFEPSATNAWTSIAISLKRIADHLAKHEPPTTLRR